jgi:nitroreductase
LCNVVSIKLRIISCIVPHRTVFAKFAVYHNNVKMKNTINQLIRQRRSTYPVNFEAGRKIDPSIVAELLETAVWAPTHGLTQPWAFRVFQGEGIGIFFNKLKEIYREITPAENFKESKLLKYDEKINQVSHVIAVCMIRDSKKKYPEVEELVATACVMENIYLCLEPYGIAGYLSTGDVCYTKQLKDFLCLGDEDQCLGLFQLGYPIEGINRPERKRIPATEKTIWVD